jgi:dTDP-glucose pyrophosphorylase
MTLLPKLIVDSDSTIRDAMAAIDANAREVVLVKDAQSGIAGLVTDGDIRRGLLAGLGLQDPVTAVMKRDFFWVTPEVDRAAVLDLMRARMFRHVPVLDTDGGLLAVHFLQDLIGAVRKPNIAVVMAGGKGTRLRPITDNIPKPMVAVAGRPMLERIVLHLVGHGITTIYLAVNYMGEVIQRHFGDGALLGCDIRYLCEPKPLDTGGPLSLLSERPEHPLFVLNGDQVMRVDLSAMLDLHVASGYAATIAVGTHRVELPYASVVERNGRLVALEEKPTVDFLINRGIYVLNPDVLDHVPKHREFPITRLFEKLLQADRPIGLFHSEDYWVDVGQPSDLRRVNGLPP